MIFIFAQIFRMLAEGLVNLLPDSPIQTLIPSLTGLQLGLGYLNFFVPVNLCFAAMTLWLGVIVAITAVRVALVRGTKFSIDALGIGKK